MLSFLSNPGNPDFQAAVHGAAELGVPHGFQKIHDNTEIVVMVELLDLFGNDAAILLQFSDLALVKLGVKGQVLVAAKEEVFETAEPKQAVEALAGQDPAGDIGRLDEIGVVEEFFVKPDEVEKGADQLFVPQQHVDADEVETDPFLGTRKGTPIQLCVCFVAGSFKEKQLHGRPCPQTLWLSPCNNSGHKKQGYLMRS